LVAWRRAGWPEAGRGLGFAAGLTVAAFLVLLVPGTRTPPARVELSALVPAPPPPAPPLAPTAAPPVDAPLALPSAVPSPGAPASPGAVALEDFVATLSGPLQQSLSDALAAYRTAPEHRPARARYTLGPRTAPVRITEFTDVLCPHCADLHRTIAYLRSNAPAGSFQVEPRQYPLDGACNPQVQRMGSPVRCLGARAKICMEGKPGADAFTGALFENQRELTEQRVYELAAPHMPRAELEACVASAETNARLQEDIQEASRHDVTGTPLVLVNGRKGSPYGPFLYAMILNRGLPWHPSFNALPPPRAQDPHGH
jgi:serine/threonine-protein kinase